MNNKLMLKCSLPFMVLLLLSSNVFSALPQSINYQAYLKDSTGLPVNGAPAITFRIYDALTGGNLLWNVVLAVPVTDGLFSVELGAPANPLPLAAMNNPL